MTDYDNMEVYDDHDDVEDSITTDDTTSQYDNSSYFTDNDDTIDVSDNDVTALHDRVEGMERHDDGSQPSFLGRPCPSNHGCSGATSCDSCYDNYPY